MARTGIVKQILDIAIHRWKQDLTISYIYTTAYSTLAHSIYRLNLLKYSMVAR